MPPEATESIRSLELELSGGPKFRGVGAGNRVWPSAGALQALSHWAVPPVPANLIEIKVSHQENFSSKCLQHWVIPAIWRTTTLSQIHLENKKGEMLWRHWRAELIKHEQERYLTDATITSTSVQLSSIKWRQCIVNKLKLSQKCQVIYHRTMGQCIYCIKRTEEKFLTAGTGKMFSKLRMHYF